MLEWYSRWKFSILLATLVGYVVILPFFEGLPHHDILNQAINVLVSLALILAFARDRSLLMILLPLGIFAIMGTWSVSWLDRDTWRWVMFLDRMAAMSFMGITTVVVIHRVAAESRVTVDTLMGSVCAYILIALTWAVAYSAVEFSRPGSFTVAPSVASQIQHPIDSLNDWIDFSFMTLTTLGSNEIAPKSRGAGSLTWMEVLAGQFYLAVLVARLVGLHTVPNQETSED